ncbi:hypothetical protein TNCV_1261161 [Trichonephila clavipes]|nr:hypothetical protein TNCV_1261161 [Trichonephila clavipes]
MSAADLFLAVKKRITERISHLVGDSITLNILKTLSEDYTTATEQEMALVCSQRMLVSDAETRCKFRIKVTNEAAQIRRKEPVKIGFEAENITTRQKRSPCQVAITGLLRYHYTFDDKLSVCATEVQEIIDLSESINSNILKQN